ncbi:unnamed protein product [Pleuronectes platessa]|uniref:Uncharacterized protein n=1 Tax=Pleuronectes platessa TaxID=8262 RepID=A0A9N7VK44_PLEPL|nr:unnamed protein product [Pleuronectes platessa]
MTQFILSAPAAGGRRERKREREIEEREIHLQHGLRPEKLLLDQPGLHLCHISERLLVRFTLFKSDCEVQFPPSSSSSCNDEE